MNFMKYTSFFFVLPLFVFWGMFSFVFADGPVVTPRFNNPLGEDINTVQQFFEIILTNIVIPIGAIVVAFFIIWSGFLFVTAGGNEEKIKTARTTFTWTMIGAAILLGAWAITEAIEATICQIASDTPGCPDASQE